MTGIMVLTPSNLFSANWFHIIPMESYQIGLKIMFEEKKLVKESNYDQPIISKRREMTEIWKIEISRQDLVSKFNDIPFRITHGVGKKMA